MLLGYCVLSTHEESLLWKPLVGNEPYAFNKPMIAIYYGRVCTYLNEYSTITNILNSWYGLYVTKQEKYYIKLRRTDNEHTQYIHIQKVACPLISPSIQQIGILIHRIFIRRWNTTHGWYWYWTHDIIGFDHY